MKQFDVFETDHGLYCVVQHDFLGGGRVTLCAPLIRTDDAPIKGITPVIDIANVRYLLDLLSQVTIQKTRLKKRVTALAPNRDEILDALNLIYWGI